MKPNIRVGLIGCGVVGTGVLQVFAAHPDVNLVVTRIAVRDVHRPRASFVDPAKLVDNWRLVCEASDVDLVIEVMGGIDTAYDVVRHALENGKHVVTANKALMAVHGDALRQLARRSGLQLRNEASVLGGIPALHTLETYFRLNRVTGLRGIVNGTCNYILTQMYEQGTAFDDALKQAQALGYAEPDPSSDVEGTDALYKLMILLCAIGSDPSQLSSEQRQSNATYERKPELPGAQLTEEVKGITNVSTEAIAQAKVSGQKIKHIASAVWNETTCSFECAIRPELISPSDPLFAVDNVNNALQIEGDIVGNITLVGPGAGALPTASAVLEDVLKIAENAE